MEYLYGASQRGKPGPLYTSRQGARPRRPSGQINRPNPDPWGGGDRVRDAGVFVYVGDLKR